MLRYFYERNASATGAATGVNLARDIEQGLFDRFLVAPVPRAALLVGPILGAVTRSLVPATAVLVVGLVLGAELPGGVLGYDPGELAQIAKKMMTGSRNLESDRVLVAGLACRLASPLKPRSK